MGSQCETTFCHLKFLLSFDCDALAVGLGVVLTHVFPDGDRIADCICP